MTLTTRREHAGGAAPTTLSSILAFAGTTISVTSGTGWPTGVIGPFVVTLERGTVNEERVLCQSRTGNVLTVATSGRGWDGTVAREHAAGAVIEHTWSTTEADEASAHNSATAAHGVDEVAGLTEVQTMTNKTLTAPQLNAAVIAGGAMSGTISGSPTFSGTPVFSGNPNFTGAPTIPNFTNAGHDHGDADDGGNIPQASVTNLVADLAAKIPLSQKAAASGVASLDASTLLPTAQLPTIPTAKLPSIPYANLPVGSAAGTTVADGGHTHDAAIAANSAVLTERILGAGDVDVPRSLASSGALAAGVYLIIAACKGFSCAGAGSSTRVRWQLSTTSGTLRTGPVQTENDTVTIRGGATVMGVLVNAGSATVTFEAVKDNDSGTAATTSTNGDFTVVRLSDLA